MKYLIEPNSEFKLSIQNDMIGVQDNTNFVPLLQIAENVKPGQIFPIFSRLWSCGWLLSNWSTALMWKLDKLSSVVTGINQELARLMQTSKGEVRDGLSIDRIQFELQKTSIAWCSSVQGDGNRT